jgi:bifunctional N-acetylglucosamine-1-phosphate-uridyltransferase/glucosamine-1-phosphate-acetyltransferase GlmU-like protein
MAMQFQKFTLLFFILLSIDSFSQSLPNDTVFLVDGTFITGEILQTYIPYKENGNVQKEYYLTDIVKIVKNNTDTIINTYLIDEKQNNIISGVNTPEELFKLELSF